MKRAVILAGSVRRPGAGLAGKSPGRRLWQSLVFGSVSASLLFTAAVNAGELPQVQRDSDWYRQAQATLAQKLALKTSPRAKNVIVFLGDGMGVSTLTAARILEGQMDGAPGEENTLGPEAFPYSALVKTYNTNQQTPDSAGTMTAIATGVKTKAGIISVAPEVLRADCASSKGLELDSILAMAEDRGLATGIVTTARITHATPAATYAHSPERNWEVDSAMPAEALEQGCHDIARQLIEFDRGNGIEVMMGGGRRNFLPDSVVDGEGKKGRRADGRHLVNEWQAKTGGDYVASLEQLTALDASSGKPLLGLFESSHMRYEVDRPYDKLGEPSLTEMALAAVERLQSHPQGFFLLVESGRIDHGHHAGSAYNALHDAVAMSAAVRAVEAVTAAEETLIVVTADHSHVFAMGGYSTRGNPILGKARENTLAGEAETDFSLAKDGLPFTTLFYSNGRGMRNRGSDTNADAGYRMPINAGRADLREIDTQAAGFHQEALVPKNSETHGGEDVALHARGPGAERFRGVIEQHSIFHLILAALGWGEG